MSEDDFTEVTEESWFSRIGGAFKGILFGLVFFIAAFPLLFWNEGRSVKRYKTLKEGGGSLVSVKSDSINAANEGKLIHVSGKADTDDILTDPVFGVSANAIKLNRVVEMYQWNETSQSKTEKKLGGGTETVKTYSYSKTWSERNINSANFKKPSEHQNPGFMPYESMQQTAGRVTLGAFTLPSSLVSRISNFEPLAFGNDTPLPENLKDKARQHNSGLYIGNDPAYPQVGDVRIFFKAVKPAEASIIAGQTGNTFEPYRTKAGGTIEILQTGIHSGESMIQKAQESNKALAWILRLAGFILMMIGLNMILKPLSVFADVLPIFGSIIGAGTGIISFLISCVLSLITIAIAWIFYRPLLAVLLIAAAAGFMFAIKGRLNLKKAA